MGIEIILIIIGFVLLVKGADFLVAGGSNIAKKFHIPELVIGMTIVSIGTSFPELIVSVKSSLSGHSDISVGNVIGSNIVNLFLILGICAAIKGLPYKKQTKWIESGIAIFSTVMLMLVANNGTDNIINKAEGIILFSGCILFIIYNVIMAKKGEEFDEIKETKEEIEEGKKVSILKSIISIIIGCIALKFGGDFVVDNAVIIAKNLGITEKLISITIVAIGTSLPELVTSILATKKGDVDMALGNIIGSGILNIFFIIGISAIISPISYSIDYNRDLLLLLMGTILFAAFPFIGEKDTMTRKNAISFLVMYVLYLSSSIYFNVFI